MARMYKIKYIVDGIVVLVDETLLTNSDIKKLEAEGFIVTAK